MSEPKSETGRSRDGEDQSATTQPAGPHAKPELTNDEATPGADSLPSGDDAGDADEGVG